MIISAAVVAFAISAVFGIGVIFSVCEMLKQLDEETTEDQQPSSRYEYDLYFMDVDDYGSIRDLVNRKGNEGWRVASMNKMGNQYRILIEREKTL